MNDIYKKNEVDNGDIYVQIMRGRTISIQGAYQFFELIFPFLRLRKVLSPYSTEKRVCVGCPTQMKLT